MRLSAWQLLALERSLEYYLKAGKIDHTSASYLLEKLAKEK